MNKGKILFWIGIGLFFACLLALIIGALLDSNIPLYGKWALVLSVLALMVMIISEAVSDF